MSSALPINIIWHLHQPNYRPLGQEVFYLPWVRLHSLREYHDMAEMIERYPRTAVTFNWSPVLLQQIIEYSQGATDRMLELRKKPAGELSEEEQFQLVRGTFRANYETMIAPHPELTRLYEGWKEINEEATRQQKLSWSTDKLRDCQVWSTLLWFGFSAGDKHPEINELKEKGENFTADEKQKVKEIENELLESLIPRWKNLLEETEIEISVNPYFHPIAPLLCDYSDIEQALPDVPQPERSIKWPEDAHWHLEKAREMAADCFDQSEIGLWPSEGSLSNEFLKKVNDLGFKWTATDEALLHRNNHGDSHNSKFTGYSWRNEIPIFFRDTSISDLIGFDYSQMEVEAAVEDLFNKFGDIQKNTAEQSGRLLTIILDGENPWEHFTDAGEKFLDQFYSRLVQANDFRSVTPSDYLEENDNLPVIEDLPAGSWINGDFNIWGGSSEDVRAWELLAETREALSGWEDLDEEKTKKCWRALYAAEGSDWFWWYGEPFHSSDDDAFDQIFRENLLFIYQCGGHPEPSYLHHPLHSTETPGYEPPRYFISPDIDGKQSHYREWWGAAKIYASRTTQAMAKSTERFETIRFGSDEKNIYLSINFSHRLPAETICRFTLDETEYELGPLKERKGEIKRAEQEDGIIKESCWAYDKLLEGKLPLDETKLKPGNYCNLQIKLIEGESMFERFPVQKKLAIPLLDKKTEASEWTV